MLRTMKVGIANRTCRYLSHQGERACIAKLNDFAIPLASGHRAVEIENVSTRLSPRNGNISKFTRRFSRTWSEIALDFASTVPPAGIPTTLVISRSGRIAARVIGGVSYQGLRSLISATLAQPS